MNTPLNETAVENTIRFILDGSIITVSNIDPSLTVLQYLREQMRRSGTKEGCAEGDCGACTVVVGELIDGRVRLRSVNACILFMPMLHGKALFTVESLSPGNGAEPDKLHPVQQAMVDCHGSQCGFCTPGFVMSLFALFKTTANPDRIQINDALSGNLCRCTGYRPIIEAAQQMASYAEAASDNWLTQAARAEPTCPDTYELELIQLLEKIRPSKTLHLQHDNKQYFAPVELDEFAGLREANADATLVAGNTDVGLWVNKQLRDLPVVISLEAVSELKKIDVTESGIVISAGVSLTDAMDVLVQDYPQLNDLCRRFASMPIRNSGTLVGNVANGSPIGDSMPILIALQAELVLRKGESQRVLPLDEFYLGYQQKNLQAGEFVQSIRIPRNINNYNLASYKVCKRYDQDISAVCGAFVMGRDDSGLINHCRIAFGGVAATPARAKATEKALLGSLWNQQLVDAAKTKLTKDYSPLSDMRASSAYRLKVAQNLLQRFYLETLVDSSSVPLQLIDLEQVSL